jgi:hypothetical protein
MESSVQKLNSLYYSEYEETPTYSDHYDYLNDSLETRDQSKLLARSLDQEKGSSSSDSVKQYQFPNKLDFDGHAYNLQYTTKASEDTLVKTAYFRCIYSRPTQKRPGCPGRAIISYNCKTGSTETTCSKEHENCTSNAPRVQSSKAIVDVSDEHREIIETLALTKPTTSAITLSKEAHQLIQEKYTG